MEFRIVFHFLCCSGNLAGRGHGQLMVNSTRDFSHTKQSRIFLIPLSEDKSKIGSFISKLFLILFI